MFHMRNHLSPEISNNAGSIIQCNLVNPPQLVFYENGGLTSLVD